VRAFVENRDRAEPGDFIGKWMQLIAPAAASLKKDDAALHAGDLTALEQASVVMTLANLMTFPWIHRRVQDGEIELVGAYFDVATGGLSVYDQATARFAPVVD
jgi:carbonic anhydrase